MTEAEIVLIAREAMAQKADAFYGRPGAGDCYRAGQNDQCADVQDCLRALTLADQRRGGGRDRRRGSIYDGEVHNLVPPDWRIVQVATKGDTPATWLCGMRRGIDLAEAIGESNDALSAILAARAAALATD